MEIKKQECYMKLNEVFQMSRNEIRNEFADYFYEYFNAIFENPSKDHTEPLKGYSEYVSNLFFLADAREKSVLDAGCGFGMYSILFRILGAREVVGIDLNEEKITCFKRLLQRLDMSSEITAKLEDASKPSFDDERFDVVISNEVISHVGDQEEYLREILRILKPGGRLVLRDNNNALNKKVVDSQSEIWEKSEIGPVEGLGLDKPYIEMREDMIRSRFPESTTDQINYLSRETQGMWGEQIYREAERYLATGECRRITGFQYRNPETGEFQEFPFNPYELGNRLQSIGFTVKTLQPILPMAYWKNGRDVLLTILKAFNRFLLTHYSDGFEIVAVKQR